MASSTVTRDDIALELRSVSKTYGVGYFAKPVVRDCSFTVERGKITVMIGPSGVGKSTLVRLIAGFEPPTSGEILLDGSSIRGPGRDRLVVFQETALFPWMTTKDNVLYGPMARGDDPRRAREAADRLLERVGLRAFHAKYPAQLSGGMQRRAELARAMINDPALMILDEPFRGLDAMTRTLMLQYFASLHEESARTTLFVTTDIDEAIFLADRLLVMSNAPTAVRTTIAIDLPRPRRFVDVINDDRANAIKLEALSLLHEEAMRTFAAGGAAASEFIEAYRNRIANRDGAASGGNGVPA